MFFRNLQIYRLPAPWAMTADALADALAANTFTPASSNELLRQGWAPPRPNGGLVHAVNRQYLIKLESEKKLLPTSVINQVAAARAAEMEEVQGFAPGKKAMKELKECVADELLPRAFAIKSQTLVWIDPVNGWLVVDAASPSKADEVIKLLLKAVDRLPLESLRVQRSPVGVMTEWLSTDEAPDGFTIDQDATLRATGESKATVQWKRHTLEPDELRRHFKAGKQCTRLAMTWDSKISFVLDETLAIKSVKALDVLTEETRGTSRNDDERFDGDFMLMTGELAKMLADVVEALGGEATMSNPGEEKRAAPEGPAKGDEPVRAQQPVLSLHEHVAGQLAKRGLMVNGADLSEVLAGDGSATDPLYDQAVAVVRANQRGAISLVQRLLRIGYNRAARLMDAMEAAGVVSAATSNGDRKVLTQGAAA